MSTKPAAPKPVSQGPALTFLVAILVTFAVLFVGVHAIEALFSFINDAVSQATSGATQWIGSLR